MKESLALVPFVLFAFACSSTSTVGPVPGAMGFDRGLEGWRIDSTGGVGQNATWVAHEDAGAVSKPFVLSLTATNHDLEDRFNLHWSDRVRCRDGHLAVAVRADGGTIDQGGGLMWRVQDANNYYVCRFNPLESNFRVYVVKDGARQQLGTALVSTQLGKWHRVEVDHRGDRITCSLDGVPLLKAQDATIPAEGGVGLWTKADARTSFDELVVDAAK